MVDAAGRLALVYADAEAAERRATLAEENLSLTLADARAALVLVEEGREPLLRGIQGESEAAAARAGLDEAIAERDAAFARLTAVAMLAEPVTTIDVSLLDLAPATALSPTDQTPTVRVAEAERSAADSRIAVERTRSRPDVSARVAVEAGIADYWYKYVGLKGAIVGMRGYGESAPADKLFPYFGFTVENVVEKALSVI